MKATGTPRFDAGAEGIHLLWTWPDLLPLSVGGYDIQRRKYSESERRWVCETIDREIMDILRVRPEYPAILGPLRMRQGVTFRSLLDATFLSPLDEGGGHPPGFGSPNREQLQAALTANLSRMPFADAASYSQVFEFIQELNHPADRTHITGLARVALTFGLSRGKVVASAAALSAPLAMSLVGPELDTILVYALAPETLRICVQYPLPPEIEDQEWHDAPYIVKGLTLPIHEADPSLPRGAPEYARAKERLVGGETLDHADFERMVASLRTPVANHALGRSGERVVLVRATTDQPYEELTLEAELTALSLHPQMRRVLGFGFADRKGLTPGTTYIYRVTGRFEAADLYDDIYDVHLGPAQTTLPAYFTIRDLGIRLQVPSQIVLSPPPPKMGQQAASRRGIRVDRTGFDSSWLTPDFGIWSLILDLPRPLTKIVLEIAPGHTFTYAGGDAWAFPSIPATPLPPGPRALLSFANPITQLRLAGSGTLFTVRLPALKTGLVAIHAVTPAIPFAPQPPPAPPPLLAIYNLQQPPTILTGSIDESTSVPPRPPVGFRLNWLPAMTANFIAWPDDLDAGPPLDAIAYQIEHRTVQPPSGHGTWQAIQSGDNLSVGSRDDTAPSVRLEQGMDFDQVFPRIRPRAPTAGYALHLTDVFGQRDPASGVIRPAQPLGTYHQYQIRSMDAVGRLSAFWTLSNTARLEKRIPPPLPVGPQPPPPLDANNHLTGPPGPRARAIVAGAPGLTTDDLRILGSHSNAIILEWGWRQVERDLDPTTTEFRVYRARAPDVVNATITSVSSAPPHWELSLTCDKPLAADECAGQWLTTGGYPFLIVHNDGGTTPNVRVQPAQVKKSATPATGPVVFGRPLRAEHQRPAGWDQRVAVIPLTVNDTYQYVFYDLLTLNAAHPRDVLWVGVSAADSQPYVADELTAGSNAPRPGNESSIAACAVSARYFGQPTFSVPPPLGDVPEQVTDEPTGRQVLVSLDLPTLLGGALPAGAPVAIERCSSDDLLSRVSVSAGTVVLAYPDATVQPISFPNPGDEAAVLATLESNAPQRLASKYLLYLLAQSTQVAAFFRRISGQTDTVAAVDDRLPPKAGRFFYRVRAVDAAGHVSDGGAILPLVVRVPSTAAAAGPINQSFVANATSATIQLLVPADPDTTELLLFADVTPPFTTPEPQPEAQILRLPNRRDLYPQNGLRLQLAIGKLLSPAVVKSLADADVITDPTGQRTVKLTLNAATGSWMFLWACALTRDGFPSALKGPFGIGVN